jgi:hypothetical protein
MSTPIVKNVWLSLLVLVCIHTAVCIIADRVFTTRYTAPPGTSFEEITTPEQRARGQAVFTKMTHSTTRPISLIFYAIAGYVGLIAAAMWVLFHSLRAHEV